MVMTHGDVMRRRGCVGYDAMTPKILTVVVHLRFKPRGRKVDIDDKGQTTVARFCSLVTTPISEKNELVREESN